VLTQRPCAHVLRLPSRAPGRATAIGQHNATKSGPEVDLHARHHRSSQGHEMALERLNIVALIGQPVDADDTPQKARVYPPPANHGHKVVAS